MSNTKRAIITGAGFEFGHSTRVAVLIVAGQAHVQVASTMEKGSFATIDAFPVDLLGTVLLALNRADSNLLQKALLAEEMLLFSLILLLFRSHQDLTINQATKVRLLTPVALVERAMIICVSLGFAEICVTFFEYALVLEEALSFGVDKGLFFDLFLQSHQGVQVLANGFRDALSLDLLIALGAAHKGE